MSAGEEERASGAGPLLGVLIPIALRAATARRGVFSAVLPPYLLREGVPAAEGVLGKKRGFELEGLSLASSIGASELGKSRAGGDDMMKMTMRRR